MDTGGPSGGRTVDGSLQLPELIKQSFITVSINQNSR